MKVPLRLAVALSLPILASAFRVHRSAASPRALAVPQRDVRGPKPLEMSLSNDPFSIVAFGAATFALVGASGALVYSLVSGESGLGKFLSAERQDNPFYSRRGMRIEEREDPLPWLNQFLPKFDYVEVYGREQDEAEEEVAEAAEEPQATPEETPPKA